MPAIAPGLFDDERLNTAEASKVLRLSISTMERLRSQGGGPTFEKLGTGKRSRVVYRRADLEAWCAANRFTSTSEYGRNGK